MFHGGPRRDGNRCLEAGRMASTVTKRPWRQYGQLIHSSCVTRRMNASTDSTVAGWSVGAPSPVGCAERKEADQSRNSLKTGKQTK
jgi:hypothetical protein